MTHCFLAAIVDREGKKVILLEQFELQHRRGSSHGESRIIRLAYPNETYTRIMVRPGFLQGGDFEIVAFVTCGIK